MALTVVEAERMHGIAVAGREGEKGGRIEAATEEKYGVFSLHTSNISPPRVPT
jgi:hypothetical protein